MSITQDQIEQIYSNIEKEKVQLSTYKNTHSYNSNQNLQNQIKYKKLREKPHSQNKKLRGKNHSQNKKLREKPHSQNKKSREIMQNKQHKPQRRQNKKYKSCTQHLQIEWNLRKNSFREIVEHYAFLLNDNEWNQLTREAYNFMFEYPTQEEGHRMYLMLKRRPFIKIKVIDIAVFNWYSWVYGPRGKIFFNNHK